MGCKAQAADGPFSSEEIRNARNRLSPRFLLPRTAWEQAFGARLTRLALPARWRAAEREAISSGNL